ncbi:Uma2 family endonuclease [Hassallia byssoidea VB512170]|uniref:Uma2 family endonuclease n=1 Tax=Hassallia byssoidea VB512170 TaxID=1304833 RepID=A0A846HBB9_9CYAN|nr:Uma2 family endonuclease [Hassalia byssoidea]NEU74363.1 Uma2 family endonuclease [Hassalia byssoidea VB512170]
MQVTEKQYYSPEEYLAREDAADYKSEYIDGEIIPMAGGSTNHNQIALNFSTELNSAFKTQDYEVFMSDVRLWIPSRRIYTYPNVMIVAGELEYFNNRTDTITNPRVIIEVLSDSTQGYDKKGKFEFYRTIPSFEEYLLIDQTKIYVEQFSKTANKRWSFREYDVEDEAIALASVQFEISLIHVYNKVKFAAVASGESADAT